MNDTKLFDAIARKTNKYISFSDWAESIGFDYRKASATIMRHKRGKAKRYPRGQALIIVRAYVNLTGVAIGQVEPDVPPPPEVDNVLP